MIDSERWERYCADVRASDRAYRERERHERDESRKHQRRIDTRYHIARVLVLGLAFVIINVAVVAEACTR